ncbi:MAG: nodulation protein NfeD [Tannerella sp.]|jgi:membrane-bound serine protease (ClpP class)|nr:nodulation protein NfeD [Tannerella sp.]
MKQKQRNICRTGGSLICLLAGFILQVPAQPAAHQALVYKIEIKKEINQTTQIYLSRGLNEAQSLGADAVLIHLNTYGGLLDPADSMRTAILYSPVPVYVFIDNNAASAGALISLACRKIYMRKGASMGAATVVDGSGEAMPDKYQSYMRSMMRSTAEAHGKDTIIQGRDTSYRWKRDPQIAEAMVDDRVAIPNLIDSGKTLTFTAGEALQWGYCDGIAGSVEEVVTQYLGFREYRLASYDPSWLDEARGFLMHPVLQSLLILLILGGIYFELQTPGVGFPLGAAVVAAVLYFAPLYMEGLAANWEILLFVIGVILVILEVFVIPGFGVAGIGGMTLMVSGFTLGLLNNTAFHFDGIGGAEVGRAFVTVWIGIILGMACVLWLSHRIGRRGLFRRVALMADLEEAVSSPALGGLAGKDGFAATVLRPSGKVIIEGEIYDGISESGFIDRGTPVRVVRFEQAQVYVEKTPERTPERTS